MSFDLHFLHASGNSIDFDEWDAWFSSKQHFEISRADSGLRQACYENEATTVGFIFDYDGDDTDWFEDWPRMPDGYVSSGASVSLNFLRPHFFGLEAMPVIIEFAKAFDLLIFDPQNNDDVRLSFGGFEPAELFERWERSNRKAFEMIDAREDVETHQILRAKSLMFWQWMSQRDAFQAHLDEREIDAFVPTIFLLCRQGQSECVTAIIWGAGVPTVFPDIDIVVCDAPRLGPLGKTKGMDTKIVEAAAIRGWLGAAPPVLAANPDLVVLPGLGDRDMHRLMKSLPTGERLDSFQRIGPMGLLD